MHGIIGVSGVLCQTHHSAEAAAVGVDEEFAKWEGKMAGFLKSFSSRELTKKVFIGIGAVSLLVGIAILSSDTGGGVFMLILGLLAVAGGFSYPMIIEKVVINHSNNMPDSMAESRPQLPGREIPSYTEDSVRDFVNGGMVI